MTTPNSTNPGVQPEPAPKPASPAAATAAPEPAKKKMKLWKKLLLITGGSILGLILLILIIGPTIISSVAKSKIPSILGPMLNADVTVGDVSFSWSGHVSLDNFKIVPKGFSNPLVDVKKVDVKVAVGSAIGGKYIAEIEVVAPKVVVEKGANGKFNYEFEMPKSEESPKDKEKDKEKDKNAKKPHVEALLKVRDGEVTIHGKGATTQYRNLSVGAKVDTLEKPIEYSLSLESPENDKVAVNGSIDLEKMSGPATVKLEHFALKNLTGAVRAYSDVLELGGTVDGSLDYVLQGAPHFAGKGRIEISNLLVKMHDPVLKRDQTMKLDRLTFTHDVSLDEKKVATHKITLKSGAALDTTIVAKVDDPLGARKCHTDIAFESDLKALAQTLRNLEALPPDMELAGKISVKGTTDTQGPTDEDLKAGKMAIPMKLDLELSGRALDITLKKGEPPMKLDGFTFHHAGELDPQGNGKHTLTFAMGKAVDSKVEIALKNTFTKPEVTTDLKVGSDLAELARTLQGLMGLKPEMKLEGQVGMEAHLATVGPDLEAMKKDPKAKPAVAAKADLGLTASNLVAIDAENKRIDIDKRIALKLKGSWDGKATGNLETLTLESSFATADARGGATLKGEDVEIRPTTATLNANLEKLNSKLESFMKDPPGLKGTVKVDAKYEGDKVTVDAAVKGFEAKLKERVKVEGKEVVKETRYGPLDISITDNGTMDKEANGKQSIRVDSGDAIALGIELNLQNTLKENRAVTADVDLKSDLGALAKILPPGMVQLKEDTDLGGKATMVVKVKTGSVPSPKKGAPPAMTVSYDVSAELGNLEAIDRKTKKRSEIDKSITLKTKGVWDGGKNDVNLDSLDLKSASGIIAADAKGGFVLTEPMAVRQSGLNLKMDLAALGAKLGLFMADPPALTGSVEATASYAGDRYGADATLAGVTIKTKQTVKENGKDVVKTSTIGPVDLRMVQSGTLSLDPNGGLKIETCKIDSKPFVAEITGEIRKVQQDDRTGGITLKATVNPVELTKWMPDLNLGGPKIELTTTVGMKPNQITVKGSTKLDGLTMTDKDPATGKPVTKTAKTGPVDFSVEINQKEIAKDKPKQMDLVAGAKVALFEWVDPAYSAKGALTADVTFNPDKGTTGTTKIANLEIADDKKNVVKDPGVTIVHDIAMTSKEEKGKKTQVITLKKTELSASFVRGTVAGEITIDDKGQTFKGLAVDFKYHPDKLNTVLAPFMPGKKIEGAEEKTLKLTLDGRAEAGDILAVLRGTKAGVDVDLAKFTMEGLTVSGKVQVGLSGGVLTMENPLDLNKGKTDLKIRGDFNPAAKAPKSEIAFNAKDVQANGKMKILQLINPIFHVDEQGDSSVDGLINANFKVAWNGAIDPGWKTEEMETAIVNSVKGTGVFGVKNLKIVGSQTVTQLMTLLGEGNSIQGELVASDIDLGVARPGWCHYDNMVLRMARYEIKFRGYVSLVANTHRDPKTGNPGERALDKMEIEIPMTENLVKSHAGLAKYLGQRFWIPLKGTVEHPTLDYKALFTELAKKALEAGVTDKLQDLLKKKKDK